MSKSDRFDKFRFDLAYKLRLIREVHDFTLEMMADKFNTCTSTVRFYESGRETPNLLYLYDIANFSGVTLDDLVLLDKKEFTKKLYFG